MFMSQMTKLFTLSMIFVLIFNSGKANALDLGDILRPLIKDVVETVVDNIIEHERQKRLDSRKQVLKEYETSGVTAPTQPLVLIEKLVAAPDSVFYGQEVQVLSEYQILNMPEKQMPKGTFRLLKDGKVIAEKPFEVSGEGRHQYELKLKTPTDLLLGVYTVQIELSNGSDPAVQSVTQFELKKA